MITKSYSNDQFPVFQKIDEETWHYNTNIRQVEVEEYTGDGEPTTRMAWECDQITIKSQTEPTNDNIRELRQEQYKLRSDSLYLAYQKYTALGNEEKAVTAKQAWLDEVERIESEYPYME